MSQVDVLSSATGTFPNTGRQQFSQLRQDCLSYVGLDGDARLDALAGRFLHDIIDDLNRRKLWKFNLIQAADITTSAGTATYPVPADLWQIYSVRKADSVDYLMTSMQPRQFDIMFQSQNAITGYPYIRTHFNIYRDGTFKLFPTPDGAYTVVLRYFRLIPKPTQDGETLDVPPPYQSVIKYGLLARLAVFANHPRLDYWEAKFEQGYKEMNRADEHQDDAMLRLASMQETSKFAYLNPNARVRYADWY